MKAGTRLIRAGVAVLAALAFGAGIAYATVSGGDDVINGCVGPSGFLEVVDADGQCGSNETAISWNQTGPPGADGEDGQDGQDGAPGAAVAYGRIGAGGAVVAEFSSNFTQANVTHPAPGLYCIGGLPFTPRSVVATGDSGIDGAGNPIFVDTLITVRVTTPGVSFPLGCAETDTVRVRTIAATAGTALVDRGFNIWFED
jgi:hypothetical protein